ncbi:MAG: hemin uptake protein HemP [Mangrovicoccus sp.]|nr:hemin uptake protein HemP [Mangrovicoccus sp.]
MNARPVLGLPLRPCPGSGPVAPAEPADLPPVHDARHLTGGGTTAVIVLDGKSYVLRITRAGKLILTK